MINLDTAIKLTAGAGEPYYVYCGEKVKRYTLEELSIFDMETTMVIGIYPHFIWGECYGIALEFKEEEHNE